MIYIVPIVLDSSNCRSPKYFVNHPEISRTCIDLDGENWMLVKSKLSREMHDQLEQRLDVYALPPINSFLTTDQVNEFVSFLWNVNLPTSIVKTNVRVRLIVRRMIVFFRIRAIAKRQRFNLGSANLNRSIKSLNGMQIARLKSLADELVPDEEYIIDPDMSLRGFLISLVRKASSEPISLDKYWI